MKYLTNPIVRLVWLPLLVSILGCGNGDRPPLGYVSGRVTINGEPLVGVIVTFMPSSGRPAVATTDAQGNYVIEYVEGAKGSKLGPTTVIFMTPTGGTTSHPIPARYQSGNEFQVEVQKGKNEFNFELKSDSSSAKPSAAQRKGPVPD